MEGAIFPHRPAFPAGAAPRPTVGAGQTPPSLSFKPPPSPLPTTPTPTTTTFPVDSLLHHLLQLSSPPITPALPKPPTFPDHPFPDTTQLDFLSESGKVVLDFIVKQPLSSLRPFLDAAKADILEVDLVGVLKGLELSGDWEKSLVVFQWIVSNAQEVKPRLGDQTIEAIVRVLGKESQHSVASKMFDAIPIELYDLDVRAYTTVLHLTPRAESTTRPLPCLSK